MGPVVDGAAYRAQSAATIWFSAFLGAHVRSALGSIRYLRGAETEPARKNEGPDGLLSAKARKDPKALFG